MSTRKSFQLLCCCLFTLLLCEPYLTSSLLAQSNLAEQLGYKSTDKLLIIHADDLGVTHSENQASFKSIKDGSVNSASIMAPTPWLAEVAAYVKEHPNHDFGMHLTLTSEWKWLRWGPVSTSTEVPSLVDENGFLYPDCQTLAQHATPEDVEKELRAQVQQAIRMGIQPTHLDSHMGCLFFGRPAYFGAYLKVAREFGIPAMVGREELEQFGAEMKAYLAPDDLLVDRVITAGPADFRGEGGMAAYYTKSLNELKSGVSVLLIHCAYEDRESQGMSVDHPLWGANWRQQDTDFFNSQACLKLLRENNIKLVTWKEVGRLMK